MPFESGFFKSAALAQLDRASGFEPEGRAFESLRPRIFLLQIHFAILPPPRFSLGYVHHGTRPRSKTSASLSGSRLFAERARCRLAGGFKSFEKIAGESTATYRQ